MAHRFYNTKTWKKIRDARFSVEPCCRYCTAQGKMKAADTVDHIEPHKGDWELFTDFENTQSLCAHCHNSVKQAQEKYPWHKVIGVDGFPVDPRHKLYKYY